MHQQQHKWATYLWRCLPEEAPVKEIPVKAYSADSTDFINDYEC